MAMIACLAAPVLEAAPPTATPPQSEVDALAGIYVQCPRKNEARCDQAVDDFRMVFPNGQPHPFFMIRKGGNGYLAADERMTTDFIIEDHSPETLIFRMDDRSKSRLELQRRGKVWRDRQRGDIYIKAIEDSEWNVVPEPFKNKQRKSK